MSLSDLSGKACSESYKSVLLHPWFGAGTKNPVIKKGGNQKNKKK
jgi:hypothetical protein